MTSAPGHETSPDGPITVINVFEVPADQVGEFIARWRTRAEIMAAGTRDSGTQGCTGRPPLRRASSW